MLVSHGEAGGQEVSTTFLQADLVETGASVSSSVWHIINAPRGLRIAQAVNDFLESMRS